MLFSLAVTFGLDIQQIDVNNAFLNGDLVEEVLYLSLRVLYIPSCPLMYVAWKNPSGLKQAPKAWYTKIRDALQSWGFSKAMSDASLFIKQC